MGKLSASRARELLCYDEETGVFIWHGLSGKASRLNGCRAGSYNTSLGYRVIGVDGVRHYEHRLAVLLMTGKWPEFDVDHIDGDGANNSWGNLRLATRTQNNANSKKNRRNTSGYKGVYFDKRKGRWMSQTKHEGRRIFVGYFDTPWEAHKAYEAMLTRLHGEFARS